LWLGRNDERQLAACREPMQKWQRKRDENFAVIYRQLNDSTKAANSDEKPGWPAAGRPS
jgi:hypothetical protein